jgi:hypothetical protein
MDHQELTIRAQQIKQNTLEELQAIESRVCELEKLHLLPKPLRPFESIDLTWPADPKVEVVNLSEIDDGLGGVLQPCAIGDDRIGFGTYFYGYEGMKMAVLNVNDPSLSSVFNIKASTPDDIYRVNKTVFDGRYLYAIGDINTKTKYDSPQKLIRVDTTTGSVSSLDFGAPRGFAAAVYDGSRFLYAFSRYHYRTKPYQTIAEGYVTKIDTYNFSLEYVEEIDLRAIDESLTGFADVVKVGRFLFAISLLNQPNDAYFNRLVKIDTSLFPMRKSVEWIDCLEIDKKLGGIDSIATDGEYLYCPAYYRYHLKKEDDGNFMSYRSGLLWKISIQDWKDRKGYECLDLEAVSPRFRGHISIAIVGNRLYIPSYHNQSGDNYDPGWVLSVDKNEFSLKSLKKLELGKIAGRGAQFHGNGIAIGDRLYLFSYYSAGSHDNRVISFEVLKDNG